MRPLIYALFLSGLATPSHGRAIEHVSLSHLFARDTCAEGGQPGAVYLQTTTIDPTETMPMEKKWKWRSAGAATSCITEVDVTREVAERENVESTSISFIEPDHGGHCMAFHSEDCADQTGMQLLNPLDLPLLFKK
jgi:hypothetical protein